MAKTFAQASFFASSTFPRLTSPKVENARPARHITNSECTTEENDSVSLNVSVNSRSGVSSIISSFWLCPSFPLADRFVSAQAKVSHEFDLPPMVIRTSFPQSTNGSLPPRRFLAMPLAGFSSPPRPLVFFTSCVKTWDCNCWKSGPNMPANLCMTCSSMITIAARS